MADAIGAAIYTGRITDGIDLQNNPATIAGGAYVTNTGGPVAVFGTSGTAWTVVNFGTIAATDAIYLQSGGSIANAGRISGSSLGVVIGGAAGTVTNSGYISGGVELRGGGGVINQGGIEGYLDGVAVSGGTGEVTNSGSILSTGLSSAGIYLSGGGYVSNALGALISVQAQGIAIGNGAGTIVNLGAVTVSTAAGIGVHMTDGGSLVNGDGAQIAGSLLGVAISGATATITNSGTISADGPQGAGVYLTAGGYLDNTSTGLIEGGEQGVKISGGNATVVDAGTIIGGYGLIVDPGTAGYATVTVAGTIIGTTTIVASGYTFQDAIQLVSGTDRLIIDPGADIVGDISGGGLATLELAAGSGIGTLAAFHSTVFGFGTVIVDPGATWQLDGDAASTQFTNDGTIIVAEGEAMAFGSVGEDAGSKGVIDVGGTATFDGSVSKGQSVVFTDRDASLVLDDLRGFAARIEHFKAGDTIDIADEQVTGTYADGKLTLTNAKGRTVGVLRFVGHYTASEFGFSSDGSGGTLITLDPAAIASYSGFGGASAPVLSPWEAASTAPWWVMRG